jgi:hypothetical protein
MHKTAAALAVLALTALVIALAAVSPLASRALAATHTQAVCTTDAECATWDAEHYAMPVLEPADDGGEAYVCPRGMELYDTEMPELGAQGVVCRTYLMEV